MRRFPLPHLRLSPILHAKFEHSTQRAVYTALITGKTFFKLK